MPDGQSALTQTLNRGLAPRAVAIYGASARKLTSQAARIAGKVISNGYEGRVVLVNPNAQVVHGVSTVARAVESPLASELDLAIIAVPREAALAALDDCAAAGIGLAVVTSARFAEADERGAELQHELTVRAAEYGIRLIGPNCMGLINYTDGLVAAGRENTAPPGSISVVAQSGYLSMRLMNYIEETGQGVDLWVTMGNCADLTPADLIEYLGSRPSTSVVIVYLENVADPQRLSDAIKAARAAGTDVVLLKSGRTSIGSQVAASHTGALASPDVFVDVLAQDADAIRVDTVREAVQVASLISAFGRRPARSVSAHERVGRRLRPGRGLVRAAIAASGPAVRGHDQPDASDRPRGRARPIRSTSAHSRSTARTGSSRSCEFSPRTPTSGASCSWTGGVWRRSRPPMDRASISPRSASRASLPVPIIIDSRVKEWQRKVLVDAGFAVTSDGETIWRSLGHIVRQARIAGQLPEAGPAPVDSAADPQDDVAPAARVPELEAFERLRAAGLPMIATERIHSTDELLDTGRRLGYPVVMKGLITGRGPQGRRTARPSRRVGRRAGNRRLQAPFRHRLVARR